MFSVHGPNTVKSVLNFHNAQKCAFLMMMCLSLYHGVLMVTKPGGNLCKSLLSDGSAGPDGEWRPYGCMTHIYSTSDSRRCMDQLATWSDSTRLYFIGDSRLFNLFSAFDRHLNGSNVPSKQKIHPNKSADVTVLKHNYSMMCFFRHNEINPSMISLIDEWNKMQKGIPLRSMKSSGRLANRTQNVSRGFSPGTSTCGSIPPTHLVISVGTVRNSCVRVRVCLYIV
ncbi:hypothetical protein D915_010353 [Fasciola hepatica]|uniref:Uncharacterized protein n=1 Tax=Fasciola hepatica TaxID=6192 RepID=A0A4E0RB93_FASHE|nr:hypothetical protein D915_010353 [Fasciola hepatica]